MAAIPVLLVNCRECGGKGYAPMDEGDDAQICRCDYCEGTGSHPPERSVRPRVRIVKDTPPHPMDSDEWFRRMCGDAA